MVDTRGINVWCAAGKGTFSTEEVAYQVLRSRLRERVSHTRLILPQLAAVGVAALPLKKQCGFQCIFGPVQISDLPKYLEQDMKSDEKMRSVTFTLRERLTLVPVEVLLNYKPLVISLFFATLIAGIGPHIYSGAIAVERGGQFLIATLLAIFSGAIITPICLPWIPFRQFWLKGLLASLPTSIFLAKIYMGVLGATATVALICWIVAVSSFLAMNFTGSTPYTSLSGVEAEMRKGLAFQISLTAVALSLWIATPFL